jgi:hypothetical protein
MEPEGTPRTRAREGHEERRPVQWLLVFAAAAAIAVAGAGYWYARTGETISVEGRGGQLALAALMVVCLSDRIGWARGVLWSWSPLVLIALCYDLVRSHGAELALRAHVSPPIRVDDALFGTVPTVWLQETLHTPGRIGALDYLMWAFHFSHFVVGVAVAFVLWRRSRDRFQMYALAMTGMTLAGYLTYLAFPAVPPWMASQMGALEPTVRITAEVWAQTGIESLARPFQGGNGLANDVGALPSLHAAYPALIAMLFWRRAGTFVRTLLATYPLGMAFMLVYGAEHYVADILLGWLYAALTAFIVWTFRARQMRV